MYNPNTYKKFKRGRVRHDYSRKHLANPFYHKKKKHLGISVIIIIILIFIIGLAYLLLLSPVLKINQINVTGNQNLKTEDIINQLNHKRNLIIFNREANITTLKTAFNLKAITIRKKLLHTIDINITERTPLFVFMENNRYYRIDEDSVILEELFNISTSTEMGMPIIENLSPNKVQDQRVDLNLNFFNEVIGKLTAMNLKINKFIIDANFRAIEAQTASSTVILFNYEEGIDGQLNKLKLLGEQLDSGLKDIKKIDLRYDKTIYYQ